MIEMKAKKKRVPVKPEFRLAGRFLVLVYQYFEVLEKQAMVLNYRSVAEHFSMIVTGAKSGNLLSELTSWLWSIYSIRSRNYNNREETDLWKVSKAQAELFIEKNRELLAEMELST